MMFFAVALLVSAVVFGTRWFAGSDLPGEPAVKDAPGALPDIGVTSLPEPEAADAPQDDTGDEPDASVQPEPTAAFPPEPQTPPPAEVPPSPPPTVTVEVEGDDAGLYPPTVIVANGATVQLTFQVRAQGVYYGGLDFRSEKFTTGTILPGGQKTVTFTADASFPYASYWPASGVKKADGMVVVQ